MKDFRKQEAFVRKRVRRDLARSVRLANDTLRLGVRIVQSRDHTSKGPAMNAMSFMATRLLNDLRVCELLAQTGYVIQCIGTTAAAFELAYRALYIGTTDERAREWAQHKDLRYSYPRNLKETMRAVYRDGDKAEQRADLMYKNRYQPLAAAKHANPKALQSFGYSHSGDVAHVYLGPTYGTVEVRASQQALVEGVRLVLMVLDNMMRRHFPKDARSEFDRPMSRLTRRLEVLGRSLLKPPPTPAPAP